MFSRSNSAMAEGQPIAQGMEKNSKVEDCLAKISERIRKKFRDAKAELKKASVLIAATPMTSVPPEASDEMETVETSEKNKQCNTIPMTEFGKTSKPIAEIPISEIPIAAIPMAWVFPDASNKEETVETFEKNKRCKTIPMTEASDEMEAVEAPRRKKRCRTTLIGETFKSFEIPSDCFELVKIIEQVYGNDYGSKLAERLDGWKFECRRRTSGLFDTFYSHRKSGSVRFRSINEVVDFIIVPDFRPTQKQKRTTAPTEGCSGSKTAEASPRENQEVMEINVKDFLEEAYQNMLNYVLQNSESFKHSK